MAIYKLGDIASVSDGYHGGFPDGDEIPFISAKDISWTKINLDTKKISVNNYEKSKSRSNVKVNTILFTNSGSLGKMHISKREYRVAVQKSIALINVYDESTVKSKYLSLLLFSKKREIIASASGSAQKNILLRDLKDWKLNLCPIAEQQKIIDIIEQNEQLFLSYSKCVRIDSVENVKKDMKSLIDIIEPIESEINAISLMIENIKNALIVKYELLSAPLIKITEKINLANNRWEKQLKYFATNAVGELNIDENKVQILDESKIPSRADVSPSKNSFIVSKLKGENKVYFFGEKPSEVFSTGFFNIETKYTDHLMGFLLSNSFKKQKNIFSTGTTMQGLGNATLSSIMIKESNNGDSTLSKLIYKLDNTRKNLKTLKNNMVKLLVK